MDYIHKSGAKKRKERDLREKAAKKGQTTLDHVSFFTKLTDSPTSVNQETLQTFQNSPIIPSTIVDKLQTYQNPITSAETFTSINIDEKKSKTVNTLFTITDPKHPGSSKPYDFDVGQFEFLILKQDDISQAVLRGPSPHPPYFPEDKEGRAFPRSVLTYTLQNNEKICRDWLVWSKIKKSLYCFPCRLFSKLPQPSRSMLSTPEGYSADNKWKKLHDRITPHENSVNHKMCYVEWRCLESRIDSKTTVDMLLCDNIKNEADRWRQILRRILDVVIFLGERGLSFRGDSHLVGNPHNGNFLGILELLSNYDPLLKEHMSKVRESQSTHSRMQVHYLSPDSQNEFIKCCSNHVTQAILKEREDAKYYSIIVDATPDSSHREQTVFILRYLTLCSTDQSSEYEVQERFLAFVDCNKKTGEAIAELIRSTLAEHHILLSDCRGQGYDNGSNMSGQYKGAQSRIMKENSLALFSPCACHSLNLCGVEAAQCCVEAITFFGNLQKCYNIFSSSPQRWEILQGHLKCSLHNMSDTRWSSRIECVKPFSMNIVGIKEAIKEVQNLNLTAETLNDLRGLSKYADSFECVIMASIWFKVLTTIDYRNKVLQTRKCTIDVEVKNLDSLINDLTHLRNNWEMILEECKLVGGNINSAITFPKKRTIRKKLADGSTQVDDCNREEKIKQVFYTIIDCVIANITVRYTAVRNIDEMFNFLWKFPKFSTAELAEKSNTFVNLYSSDVSRDLVEEINHLKSIQAANFKNDLSPLNLLNTLEKQKLKSIFPNVCIALRLFCTLPVTVAEAERSFSTLARVKNFLRSTMAQDRLSSLGTLAMEPDLARQLDYNSIIDTFANKKARKAIF